MLSFILVHSRNDRVCDGGLACSSKAIQPVHRRLSKVACPEVDFVHNSFLGSFNFINAYTIAV